MRLLTNKPEELVDSPGDLRRYWTARRSYLTHPRTVTASATRATATR